MRISDWSSDVCSSDLMVMLGFMWSMYKGMALKVAVLAGALILGVALLAINRSQALVGDVLFMKAMIPHHSIAINSARRADISDPPVRDLAAEIIASNVREIAEMTPLIQDTDRTGASAQAPEPDRPAAEKPTN